jgi:5'-nucleotidase
MRIVITNDDGIDAQGIHVLALVARGLGSSVLVIAPEQDHSGQSQAITMSRPVWVRKRKDSGTLEQYAVSGTPADCVRLVASGHFGPPPDLLLSGVNHGPNLGEDVWASGTVGAARMAACRRIPAIAVSSLCQDWSWVSRRLLRHLPVVAEWAMAFPGVLFNLNLPAYGGHLLRWTTLSQAWFTEHPIKTVSAEADVPVSWIRHPYTKWEDSTSDAATIFGGMASLTPLSVLPRPEDNQRGLEACFTPGTAVQSPAPNAPALPPSIATSQSS